GSIIFFFFQAEDGIRDSSVTGVQTCALPISREVGTDPPGTYERESDGPAPCRTRPQPAPRRLPRSPPPLRGTSRAAGVLRERHQIGRASCRERVEVSEEGDDRRTQ